MNFCKFFLILSVSSQSDFSSLCDFSNPTSASNLRVLTKHYEPFMYQNKSGSFVDGIEFKLITTVAAKLKLDIEFVQMTSKYNIEELNRADIITTGILSEYGCRDLQSFEKSIPYLQDDFVWCIQDSGYVPMYMNLFQFAPVEIWLVVVIFFIYGCGTIQFFMGELDVSNKHRHHRDWHFYVIPVVLAAVIGMSPRYNPKNSVIRFWYWTILVLALPIHGIIGTFFYNFLKEKFHRYQISTDYEIIEKGFHFVGSEDVSNLIHLDPMYSNEIVDSFEICDIDNCLIQLNRKANDKLAVGGPRQHIINCPQYSPSKIYCFKNQEHIAGFQPALRINKNLQFKSKIDEITKKLFEAGLFAMWTKDSQLKRKYETPYEAPLEMQVIHLCFPLIFVISLGSALGILTFIAESLVHRQINQHSRHRIWAHLEKIFNGHRYYFKEWPRKLEELKKTKNLKRIQKK